MTLPDPVSRLFSESGIVCETAEETQALGFALAATLGAGAVLCLEGPLGAGKTHFAAGITRGLGCRTEATSPTFALVHEYRDGRLPVFHFDFYRMDEEGELLTAGWDDCLPLGVTIAEWGDKFPASLPPDTLWVQFHLRAEGGRIIVGRRGA